MNNLLHHCFSSSQAHHKYSPELQKLFFSVNCLSAVYLKGCIVESVVQELLQGEIGSKATILGLNVLVGTKPRFGHIGEGFQYCNNHVIPGSFTDIFTTKPSSLCSLTNIQFYLYTVAHKV